MRANDAIAWVESPLQLVGAAEWAAVHRRRVPIAGRLTAQMPETADELIARGAMFGACAPYLGIPWQLLSRHRHWLVGDGFSGQFRLAAAILRPRRITFLDDGANSLPFADVLLGRREYMRPGVAEKGLTTRVAPFALDHVRGRAVRGDVDLFTAFDPGESRHRALADLGVTVTPHTFSWTRRTAAPFTAPSGRVLLGSARPGDGRMPAADYVRWVATEAAAGALTYLPHRREPADIVARVSALPGVTAVHPAIPVELLLAGTAAPLEIITLPSSTTTTLPRVLAGTGSVVRERKTPHAAPSAPARTVAT